MRKNNFLLVLALLHLLMIGTIQAQELPGENPKTAAHQTPGFMNMKF